MIDHNNKTWTRDGLMLVCEDGRQMAIAEGMTDDYLLTVIAGFDQPTVPDAVEMAQARHALLNAGLLAQVDAAIKSMPGPAGDAARIDWEFRPTVDRHSDLVGAMAAMFGLDDAALDALFIAAASL